MFHEFMPAMHKIKASSEGLLHFDKIYNYQSFSTSSKNALIKMTAIYLVTSGYMLLFAYIAKNIDRQSTVGMIDLTKYSVGAGVYTILSTSLIAYLHKVHVVFEYNEKVKMENSIAMARVSKNASLTLIKSRISYCCPIHSKETQ